MKVEEKKAIEVIKLKKNRKIEGNLIMRKKGKEILQKSNDGQDGKEI